MLDYGTFLKNLDKWDVSSLFPVKDPRVRGRIFVNGEFYNSFSDGSQQYQCNPDEPVAHYVEIDLPVELFDYCPYTVSIAIIVEGVDESGDYVACTFKTLKASAESFFLPANQTCAANSGECFDNNGQPVPCFG